MKVLRGKRAKRPSSWRAGSAPFGADRLGAFTLLEMLVVLSIITLLLAFLVPALAAARDQMKTLKCSSNAKSAAFAFHLFTIGESEKGRGESESLGASRFYIGDFLDAMYGVGEFWDIPNQSFTHIDDPHVMVCPAGPGKLLLEEGRLDPEEIIKPMENVSIALNMRFYARVVDNDGKKTFAPWRSTVLSQRVLDHPFAPLFIDVDGKEASEKSRYSYYIAPPVAGEEDPYSDGVYWSPSKRHGGKTIVGFVGGHVLSSARPEREAWDWSYQAEPK